MTPKDLLFAMTDIDEDSIWEARYPHVRRKILGRRGAMALIAAVMLMGMALTAFADPDTAAWFRQFFRDAGNQELSQGQLAYIEENTVQQSQSQTYNGYTITVDSAITDGVNAYVQMTLTAPDNVILDADYYSLDTHGIPTDENGQTFSGGGCGWSNEATDENKGDNVATLLYTMDIAPVATESSTFSQHTWTIRLKDLQATRFINWNTPDFEVKKETIAEGIWEFQVTFSENAQAIQLIIDPVPCPAEVQQWFEQGEEEVLITSFVLRALSAELTFEFPLKTDPVNARFRDIFVVMKDGTQVLIHPAWNYPNQMSFSFSAPIVLEEASHILLPNGSKIPMP